MPSPDITFPKASPSDAGSISLMAREIWNAVYSEMISAGQIEYMLEWMYSPDTLRREMGEEEIAYHLIQAGDETVGYFAFSFGAGRADLHKIYLKPAYHGRSIGSAALRWLAVFCLSKGARSIRIRVNKSNSAAIRAYERNGYRRVDSVCQDIGGGYVMDDHIYERPLP